MRFQIMPLACAALTLTLTSTAARADDGRVGRSTTPPSTAYGDGDEGACGLVTRAEASRVISGTLPAGVERSATLAVRGAGAVRAQYCLYGSDLVLGRLALGSSGARRSSSTGSRSRARRDSTTLPESATKPSRRAASSPCGMGTRRSSSTSGRAARCRTS